MRVRHILTAWLRSAFLRRRREDDLGEELRFHLDREVERLVAAGLDPAAARLQALRLFGSVEIVKEEARDSRRTTFVEHLGRDSRHAVRRLSRDRRFTGAAVVLGIGVNTALFSVVSAVLLRQYSVADTERVVDVYQNLRSGGAGANTYSSWAAWTKRCRMALGADSSQVSRAVALEVGALVAVGTAAGLGFSLLGILALRVGGSSVVTGVASMSFYRPSVDPVAMSLIALVTAFVGLAAAYVPARRAARMDPLIALRHN